MMGKKARPGKLFYQFNLEERIPPDHLLRRVAQAVDCSFVRRLTARCYSHTGQPSVDPVVLFKMALLGYLYGITSERRLVQEIDLNLAYRWFVGYDLDEAIPDHSVLSKARHRFGPTVYLGFFTEIVRQCERAGLVRGNLLYVDSTLVQADADANRVGSRALLRQLPAVGDHVSHLWQDNPDQPASATGEASAVPLRVLPPDATPEPSTPGPAPTVPAVVAPKQGGDTSPMPVQPVDERPALHIARAGDLPNRPVGLLNERTVSRTDPDAELVQQLRVPADLYYKVHVGVDGGQARIVTAVDVTGGGVADEHLLLRVLAEHEGAVGRTVQEVVADTKYGTIANYLALEARGITPSIPIHTSEPHERALPVRSFVYDPTADRYTCPAGKPLKRQGVTNTDRATPGILYRARPVDCAACTLKAGCCGKAQARTVFRADDQGVRERVGQHLETRRARVSLRRRQVWVETIFGDGKERRGLRRAHGRGLDQVRIQAWLTAIAQNVRQLAQAFDKRPASGVAALEQHVMVSPCVTFGAPRSRHRRAVLMIDVYLN